MLHRSTTFMFRTIVQQGF